MGHAIDWTISAEEIDLVDRVTNRICNLAYMDKLTMHMDIISCHLNAYRLDLEKMQDADLFHLMRDVAGISKHLNRNTGKLQDQFVPRFATEKIQD